MPSTLATGSKANDAHIRAAIGEANVGLEGPPRGWGLSADHHYQLSNRFASAWKIADLGIPVVLVYLGFLHAEEMADQGLPFGSAAEWTRGVRRHAMGVVPDLAWERPIHIGDTPIRAVIRPIGLE